MAKTLTFLGIPNLFTDEANTLTAASQAASDLSVENLREPSLGPDRAWRSLYASVASTWVRLQIAAGTFRNVGGVAFGGTNLETKTIDQDTNAPTAIARWRHRAANVNFRPRVIPDAIASASGNLVGSITAFAETDPEHPDGVWLTCSDNAGNNVRVTFPTLGGLNLLTGAGLQTFRVAVRRKAAGGTNPTIAIALYESGSLVSTLSSGTAITSATGQLVEAAFDAALLAGADGANVEVRIDATAGSTTTVEYGAVELVAEFTGAAAAYYDSGELTPSLPSATGITPLNLYSVPTSALLLNYHQFDFIDPTNPDGFIQVGTGIAGPTITTDIDVDFGCQWGREPFDVVTRSIGGRLFFDSRPSARAYAGQFIALSKEEAFDKFLDTIDLQAGVVGQLALLEYPEDTAYHHVTAAIGRLRSLSPVPHLQERYTRQIDFIESVA